MLTLDERQDRQQADSRDRDAERLIRVIALDPSSAAAWIALAKHHERLHGKHDGTSWDYRCLLPQKESGWWMHPDRDAVKMRLGIEDGFLLMGYRKGEQDDRPR